MFVSTLCKRKNDEQEEVSCKVQQEEAGRQFCHKTADAMVFVSARVAVQNDCTDGIVLHATGYFVI